MMQGRVAVSRLQAARRFGRVAVGVIWAAGEIANFAPKHPAEVLTKALAIEAKFKSKGLGGQDHRMSHHVTMCLCDVHTSRTQHISHIKTIVVVVQFGFMSMLPGWHRAPDFHDEGIGQDERAGSGCRGRCRNCCCCVGWGPLRLLVQACATLACTVRCTAWCWIVSRTIVGAVLGRF